MIFNEIEYFSFINLLLLSLFFFYIFLFFIIFNSSLILNSIYYNDMLLELFITFVSLIYVILIISPGLLLFLDFDLLTSSSFIIYILGFQWAWSYNLFFSNSFSLTFDQLIISSNAFSLGSSSSISSFSFNCPFISSSFTFLTSSFSLSLFSNYYLTLFNSYLLLNLFNHISLFITSFDVIHSFGFHSLGFKSDAIPGRINYVSSIFLMFNGSYISFCYELCGLSHSSMLSSITVLSINGSKD